MNRTRSLEQLTRADIPFAGTKAGALGELLRAGFAIPPGFVLSTTAYAELIQPLRSRIDARLTPDVIMDPAEIEAAATEIREWIEGATWPGDLEAELDAALKSIAVGEPLASYAARTSVASDDLATAFGSGVERAYLGLVGLEALERAAARCWGALWNSRAMYYRHRKNIRQTDVALAVLVQPMIRADAAGVMFTTSQVNGNADEIQIDSIWGLGAPLTSARVRPDRFRFSKKQGAILDREIVEKSVQVIVTQDGRTEQQAVAAELVEAPSLTDGQVTSLAALGQSIEKLFGAPQDIEWARVGEKFLILQSRPIALRKA